MGKPIEETVFWGIFAKTQKGVMVACYVAALSFIIINVILRLFFKINFLGYDELIVVAVLWLYFIGGSYATMTKNHVSADVFSLLVKKPKTKSVHSMIVSLVDMFLLGFLVYLCIPYITWNINAMQVSPGLKIPLLVSQSAVAVGFTFSFFYAICHFIRDWQGMMKTLKGRGA